jgi:hypothetical protein
MGEPESKLLTDEQITALDGHFDQQELGADITGEWQALVDHGKAANKDRAMWKRERNELLSMTEMLDEHPEGYDGACLCALCKSYADPE